MSEADSPRLRRAPASRSILTRILAERWDKIGDAASKIFAGWNQPVRATQPMSDELSFYRPDCPDIGQLPAFDGIIHTEKMKQVLGPRT